MKLKQVKTIIELEQALHLRELVFVHEQHCPLEQEFDQYDHLDASCIHILAVSETDQPIGTGRIRFVDGKAKLERICILESIRKSGVGHSIVTYLEKIARAQEIKHFYLHGQQQAIPFYQKLGYQPDSDLFMEDNIPHVLMRKEEDLIS
ncbi:putative GNAT family N-acyltransferase [Alkalihalobacillus xiaoxiensis]|uniref:GNAT family N-acyltransferase n=1 Tax=Shouchella xiaoxiensis TaxID=766895 RepID=A0ABS2SZT7_9BACI|nr:GNAT family N-acetyltransferase [Shouchella xiaoxiensis]MBM7841033.1 putative GNAT family N-acyltransferase [Shouchella xiaoxiensis]